MAEIMVLPKEISELIAAGEVVERPSSVIKELVENSIDAKATAITVEIEHGGITYMRVTDNGSGIPKNQIKTAFLRHATSKIKTATDLDAILTLGFRGEALASICAVSKVEVLSAVKGENGISYEIYGGEEVSFEEVGCPVGTTIIVRDLFYNVPARMKFLKKDVTEGNSVAAVMERIALSHPEVAVKFIRDGKVTINTVGDGKLKSAVYSVLGREFTSSLIPIEYNEQALSINGFVCMPSRCRPNRNGQFFFLNGRFVKSGTISAALDRAYQNSAMVGKFPAAVLNLSIPAGTVDVNVHPAKTEVRFADERRIFDLVYRGARSAIAMGDRHPELQLSAKKPTNIFAPTNEFTQAKLNIPVVDTVSFSPKNENKPIIEKTQIEASITPKTDFSKPLILNDSSAVMTDCKKINDAPIYKVILDDEFSSPLKPKADLSIRQEALSQPIIEKVEQILPENNDVAKPDLNSDINLEIDPLKIKYIG
ncbi:MAG: DNA mismatch repair endonuclease MutL, partial [Clostridia bacterium]|nr:DNA mismatch repair endonuclease MutL [Clostridia bacterium]